MKRFNLVAYVLYVVAVWGDEAFYLEFGEWVYMCVGKTKKECENMGFIILDEWFM